MRVLSSTVSYKKEAIYGATWVASTMALGIFSFYNPGIFLITAVGLAIGHVIYFNKALEEWPSSKEKTLHTWMCLACLVSSAILSAAIFTFSLFVFPRKIKLDSILWDLSLLFGGLGYGLPMVQTFYAKGLELYKLNTWPALSKYMFQNPQKKNFSFFEKFEWTLALISPEKFEWFLSPKIKLLVSPFFSIEYREKCLKEFLDLCGAVVSDRDASIALIQITLPYLQELPPDHQWHFIPRYLELAKTLRVNIEPHLPLRDKIREKRESLLIQHGSLLLKIKGSIFNDLLKSLDDPNEVENVTKKIFQLRNEISLHCKETEIFIPHLSLKELRQFEKRLLTGPLAEKLQRINSTRQVAQSIDRTDPTGDFLVVQFPNYQEFLDLFHVENPNDLDQILEKLQISTLGECIDRVLEGDENKLTQKDILYQHLKEYLASQRGLRNRFYTFLAGKMTETGSKLGRMATKTLYVSIMIFGASLPIYLQPYQAATGMVGGIFFSYSPIFRQLVTPFHGTHTELIDLAVNRPFFRLFSGSSVEIRTYDSSHFIGKIRILAIECFQGYIISAAKLNNTTLPIGGFIQGIAIGREVGRLFF